MKKIGAFFDFDETLLEVESSRIGIRYLYDEGHVNLWFIIKVLTANFFYKRNLVSDETMARYLMRFYRKKELALFEAGAPQFYHEHLKPRLAPNLVEKVNEHRRNGHLLILISASVRYYLQPVAHDLGFHHLLCTDLETGTDGLLTGRPAGPVCIDSYKKVGAEKLALTAGIDLGASYAYGNHQSDIPLLETVGNPVAVEPTPLLRKTAREKGWPILTYRS
jgi:HAD superfamily hydrolase (TIGR01490 family)